MAARRKGRTPFCSPRQKARESSARWTTCWVGLRAVLGALIAVAGVAVLVTRQGPPPAPGDPLVLREHPAWSADWKLFQRDDGGRATIPQGQSFSCLGRLAIFAPSFRMIAEMAGDTLETNIAGGPSGSRFSRWYTSDLESWERGEYKMLGSDGIFGRGGAGNRSPSPCPQPKPPPQPQPRP